MKCRGDKTCVALKGEPGKFSRSAQYVEANGIIAKSLSSEKSKSDSRYMSLFLTSPKGIVICKEFVVRYGKRKRKII